MKKLSHIPNSAEEVDRAMRAIYLEHFVPDASRTPNQGGNSWEWGKKILLNGTPQSREILKEGWSYPEDAYTWSAGHEALMVLPPPPVGTGAVLLSVEMSPYCPTTIRRQRAHVFHGERAVASFSLQTLGVYHAIIFVDSLPANEPIQLRWQFPDAQSPAKIENSGDPRILGAALRSITANPR